MRFLHNIYSQNFRFSPIAGNEEIHPIYEFLFGFEEEGYVYYPISHRDYFFYIVGLTLVLFLLLVFFFLLNYKARIRLAEQNKLLKDANDQIKASILYASQIQQALLPNAKLAKSIFTSYGVFYKPRDVVSGDFYWFSKVGDKIILLAMDCTGHGVPGAFLTLLAYQELRKIVFERKISSPAAILGELDKEFSAVLQRESEFASDGAEVGLCLIEPNIQRVTYSGAKLDLFMVRKNGVSKIKASKAWIGNGLNNFGKDRNFVDTQITCLPEDKFYMISDGFVDQFGGPSNKKFMASQLENLFNENQNLLPEEMIETLERSFFNWKGTQAQTDDVLVLGFQL